MRPPHEPSIASCILSTLLVAAGCGGKSDRHLGRHAVDAGLLSSDAKMDEASADHDGDGSPDADSGRHPPAPPFGDASSDDASKIAPGSNPEPPDGDPGTVIAEPGDEAAFLWEETALRTFDIRISEADLALLDANPAAEEYVPADLVFDGQTYGPVGVRYKGSVGAFLRPCTNATLAGPRNGPRTGKCSLKVSFNWRDRAGTFFGLRKLQFHSLGHDPSLMRERLGYGLFREMGVAAPRAVHARVLINGEFSGVYGLIEQIDGRFTRSRFSEGGKGNLYKEVWPAYDDPTVYLSALETNEDENPSVQHMVDFKAAIDHSPELAVRWIDPDLTARYLAVDRVIVNDDGIMHFWCAPGGTGANRGAWGNHNYYWYFAENSARAWLIPWDLDSSMNPDAFVQVHTPWTAQGLACACASYPGQVSIPVPQYPPSCDRLIAAWATTLRQRYESAVDDFLAGPFSAESVDQKIDAWSAQISAAVMEQADKQIVAAESGVLTEDMWRSAIQILRTKLQHMRDNRGYAY